MHRALVAVVLAVSVAVAPVPEPGAAAAVAGPAGAGAGDLDPSFDGDGRVLTNSTNGSLLRGFAVGQDARKRLLAGGSAYREEPDPGCGVCMFGIGDFQLVRYKPDGSLDGSFGNGGRVTTAFGQYVNAQLTEVAFLPDGRIVALGPYVEYPFESTTRGLVVVRYLEDGTPDLSFGDDGVVKTPITSYEAFQGTGVVVHADGRVVVSGWIGGDPDEIVLVRYEPDGDLDPTFGVGGIADTGLAGRGISVARFDGKYVVGAQAYVASGDGHDVLAAARFKANGDPDPTFGVGGLAIGPVLRGGSVRARDGAIQPGTDGSMVVVGSLEPEEDSSADTDFELVRFTGDGDLDLSFGGGDGSVLTDFGTEEDSAEALAIQADGRILAAGHDDSFRFAVARYKANGGLDDSFGGDGRVSTSFADGLQGMAITVQTDGRPVVAGYMTHIDGPLTEQMFALARYHTECSAAGSGAPPRSRSLAASACRAGLVVNDTGDDGDVRATANDGVCDADANLPDTQCTLRAALQEAAVRPGRETIRFDIGGPGVHRIRNDEQLPIVSEVTLDGTSQHGYSGKPLIEVRGASSGFTGLRIAGKGTVVKGLSVAGHVEAMRVFDDVDDVVIRDNHIGVDAAGTRALPGEARGIVLNGSGVVVRDNVISGILTGGDDAAAAIVVGEDSVGTRIQGNLIGTNAAGRAVIGNRTALRVLGEGTLIGGATAADRNVVASGPNSRGIVVAGAHTTVSGNYLGTNKAGDAVLGTGSVTITGAKDTTVGGTTSGSSNLVAGQVSVKDATRTRIRNNLFHTSDGVHRLGSSSPGAIAVIDSKDTLVANNTVGFSLSFGVWFHRSTDAQISRNLIFATKGDGVRITGDSARVSLRTNSIRGSDGGLGIDLADDGVTLGDSGDHDGGPNLRQNHPILDRAKVKGDRLHIVGVLSSNQGESFVIELYANRDCDHDELPPPPRRFNAYGEGEEFLGSVAVRLGFSGREEFAFDTSAAGMPGQGISATATDAAGNTSEFSNCVPVLER